MNLKVVGEGKKSKAHLSEPRRPEDKACTEECGLGLCEHGDRVTPAESGGVESNLRIGRQIPFTRKMGYTSISLGARL